MRNIFITKPGCNPDVIKENKTNLQLREMQMLQTALLHADASFASEIVTTNQLAEQWHRLENATVFVFNSASCFNDDLTRLFGLLSVVDNVDIILVSNDCRLNFKINAPCIDRIRTRLNDGLSVCMITNATRFLDNYAQQVLPAELASQIPVFSSNVYTLPSFLSHMPSHSAKTVQSVFACMHFKDYSTKRQDELRYLYEKLQDNLVLTGDMEGLDGVESIVTDTQVVMDWYKNAKTTPVLLEPAYDLFGVIPNRVAEAICMRCMPIILFSQGSAQPDNDIQFPYVETLPNLVEYIIRTVNQYDSNAIQGILDRLQVRLQVDRQEFVLQLKSLLQS